MDVDDLDARLRDLVHARHYDIGFPGATDQQLTALHTFLTCVLLNNVGDPWVDGWGANHTKDLERRVIEFVAQRMRADMDDYWGYVTTGGTEGNLYGLYLAREMHPDGIVYYGHDAHPSVAKAIRILRMRSVCVAGDPEAGVMDYVDLEEQLDRRRHRPAILVCTVGTTLREGHDDLHRVIGVLDMLAMRRRYIHVDAALSGLPLAVGLDPDDPTRPGFDFVDGADSIAVSGHKFLSIPTPCGVVVTRNSHRRRVAGASGYVGSPDDTITGSRSGHTPLMLWEVIRRLGVEGLRRRARASWALADYAFERITALDWPAHHGPHSMTVALRLPPPAVLGRWTLARMGEWSHIVCAPGVQPVQVDAFVEDLAEATRLPTQRQPEAAEAISV